jgi:ribosomal-protein-alanine N-acetyltransferase
MNNPKLSVRELEQRDIDLIADYWLKSDDGFLISMGVDLKKLPKRNGLVAMLSQQLSQSYAEKQSYCIIWEIDDTAVGHSNVNKIIFGEEAYMHLHIWKNDVRQKGNGSRFVQLTLPYFFKNLKLKKLYCEPFAENEAPNRTLKKAGFDFVKKHVTIPGSLNFEQEVCRWEITKKKA